MFFFLLSGETTHDSTPCTRKDGMNKDIPIIEISDDEQVRYITYVFNIYKTSCKTTDYLKHNFRIQMLII